MLERAVLFAVSIGLLSAAGCGSSMLSTYPEFPSHKARLGKSVIITDFLVLKATNSDTAEVDLAANKDAADTLLHFVQNHLDAKGYNVTNRLLSSIGLLMDSTTTARVSHSSEMDREGEDATMFFHPPFYLYQPIRRDPTVQFLLEGLYRKLTMMKEDDTGHPALAEMPPLGKVFGGGMVFIFLGGGFEVSPGGELSGVRAPGAEANSKIAYHAISQASLHMFVLDSETGNILWTDKQVIKGGMMYPAKFIRMAEHLLLDLP